LLLTEALSLLLHDIPDHPIAFSMSKEQQVIEFLSIV